MNNKPYTEMEQIMLDMLFALNKPNLNEENLEEEEEDLSNG